MGISNYVIGIDGCRSGWCLAVMYTDHIEVQICEQLKDKLSLLQGARVVFIDIPIGLGGDGITREVDIAARRILDSKKASSIFATPCRSAVYAADYRSALDINRKIMGKGFSIQSWNICNKIKETDILLQEQVDLKPMLLESHPEVTFQQLNKNEILMHKKKTREGLEERLTIMRKYSTIVNDAYQQATKSFLRKHVALDDIVDALGLGIAASLSQSIGISAVSENKLDNCGITMNIHFAKP